VHDAQGAVLQSTTVTLKNTLTGEVQTIQTDEAGFYSFPSLPVGQYEVTFEKTGFEKYHESNIMIDVDTKRRVDATMKVGNVEEQVTVTSTQAQVDTESPQMGQVIGGKEMNNIPLNGRSYTDLLALQPGVVPISVSMYSTEAPANSLNNGLYSMSGAQDVHSGFLVNGANTVDGAGEGTFLIPTLDSIAEFRIVTNNAGAEYGGYAGGVVNVITKSGTNQFHGDAFEFFRNSSLNASGFNSGTPNLKQNQFGGVLGGPILRNKIFFFGDYQGTRNSSGASVDLQVPSANDVTGNLADRVTNFGQVTQSSSGQQITIPNTVSGPYFASVLSQRFGYAVTNAEPYYFAAGWTPPSGSGNYSHNCTTSVECVFPSGVIPKKAWSPVSANVLTLIPGSNTTSGAFISNAAVQTLTEDKGAIRIDGDTRVGRISGYYHLDPWSNPAPPTFGTTVPGFPNDTIGKAQLVTVGLTTTFGSTAVNSFTASYTRNKNITGLTTGGGVTLASLGFDSPANGGIFQESSSGNENWPEIVMNNNVTVGAPLSVVSQFNNTYGGADDFNKVIRTHSLKFGAQYHWDQVDLSHPNNGSNGEFVFNGSETGDDFADMLIGAPSKFYQGSPASLNLRTFYAGAYAEDSWRANKDLTVNYGVRWEVDPFWREEHNLNPVELPGIRSTTFPTAPVGYAFPGDAGIPVHMSNINYDNFGPRVGISYSPDFSSGPLHTLFGDQGKSSVRVGYGLYFTNIEGYNTFNFAAPPFAEFYGSPAPPLFADPFIDRASGNVRINPFPLNPLADPKAVNWAPFEPFSARRNPLENSPSPYEEHLDFAVERTITSNTILSLSYVGTFGHHLTVMADGNSGNPALCLSVSQTNETTDGNTCGPGGENSVYHPVSGGTINGTRQGLGPLFQGVGWELNVGNSAYHALETTFRHTGARYSYLLSYTFSKALDNGSGRGDVIFLNGNRNYFRGLSDYDVPNNFVASYSVEMPFDKLIHVNDRITRGWIVSGVTRLTNGIPVWIQEPDDQNLLGDNRISPWGGSSTDTPEFTPGNLMGDHNPRHGNAWFNVNLFGEENLGQMGNSPRRFFHGPGINNTDMALLKDVKVREGMTAEFRAEFFNVFNHAQFEGNGSVDGNFDDGIPQFVNGQDVNGGTFGLIFGSAGGRIGQLGVKFTF
jgi:hypothetical protein